MPTRRIARINALLQRELDRYLSRSFEPPSGTLLTIEEVTTSNDLSHVNVFVSVLPVAEGAGVLKQLQGQAATIRHLLRKRLSLKMVPHIHFVADEREERAARIYTLLDKPDQEDKAGSSA